MAEVFHYTRAARPTMYNGTKYRSELEAAWAAFFDIRGIRSEYEPALDLEEWRPDFFIALEERQYELAEVKPYLSQAQWLNDKSTLRKITKSLQGSVLAVLLGASPLVPCSFIFRISPEGIEDVPEFVPLFPEPDAQLAEDWKRAKNMVQWRPV